MWVKAKALAHLQHVITYYHLQNKFKTKLLRFQDHVQGGLRPKLRVPYETEALVEYNENSVMNLGQPALSNVLHQHSQP